MNLDQTVGRELEWRQPETFRRFYQLTCNGSEVATLRFEKRSGLLATGECGNGKWTFKRTGFLSQRVSVCEAGSDTDLAIFTRSWNGKGSLVFSSGRRYQLRPTNFWATEWAFQSEGESPVVTVSGPHGFFKQGGNTRAAPSAAGSPETPLLLLLIWYLRILMNDDAAAGTVVVACSG
jgi:hypothetical protein